MSESGSKKSLSASLKNKSKQEKKPVKLNDEISLTEAMNMEIDQIHEKYRHFRKIKGESNILLDYDDSHEFGKKKISKVNYFTLIPIKTIQ